MSNIVFASPGFFYLLLLLPLMIIWHWKKNRKQFAELRVSVLDGFKVSSSRVKQNFPHILFTLRMLAFVLLIIALARPQSTSKGKNVVTEGIDIIICLDISGSMLAQDFEPNRIEASKALAEEFIADRVTDRIGMVVFAGESFTQSPLTTDHRVIKNVIKDIKSGMINDGTAIGMGLATSVSRLKESKAKSKVIILLTDGVNNSGFIDPLTAADIAQNFNIRVYTIGVGKRGMAPYPIQTPFGLQYQNVEVQIDEQVLGEIAKMTGGKYFRATNNKKLEAIYNEINQMEKTKIDVTEFRRYAEEFYNLAFWGMILLIFEIIFKLTFFRSIP